MLRYSSPTVLLTISCQSLLVFSPTILKSSSSRSSAVNENPAIADWFFYERISKFVKVSYVVFLESRIIGFDLNGNIVEVHMYMV